VEPSRADLIAIAHHIDMSEIRSIVSDVLPLARAKEAFYQGLKAHNRGKIVLRVDGSFSTLG